MMVSELMMLKTLGQMIQDLGNQQEKQILISQMILICGVLLLALMLVIQIRQQLL